MPSMSCRGKMEPQSTTTMSSSYSNAVMFLPTSPRPPSGMILSFPIGFRLLPFQKTHKYCNTIHPQRTGSGQKKRKANKHMQRMAI